MQTNPAVIALNGPPQSGKTTYVAKHLVQLIPDAVVLNPSGELYTMAQEEGLIPKGQLYHDYKMRPEAREKLIAASVILRGRDYNCFERRVTASEAYRSARVVIIDNVGHTESEFEWYDRNSRVSILLRVDTPFKELEPLKAKSRRLNNVWDGDSRRPLYHHTMLTSYDSRQMLLLLDWLHSNLTREEAGPYYGIKALWDQFFRPPESVHQYSLPGVTGKLGGLGEAALNESFDRQFRDGF